MLGVLPLYHIFGAAKLLQFPYVRGIPVVIMQKFDVVEVCKTIEKYAVSQFLVVPPMCLALWHHPGQRFSCHFERLPCSYVSIAVANYNLKSLRFLMSGAAPLGAPLVNGLTNRLKSLGVNMFLGQGMRDQLIPGNNCLTNELA